MNTLSVAISRDEDAQHDLILGFGTKGTIISGLSEDDLLEIRSAIDCAIIKGEDDAHARLVDAAPELLEALDGLLGDAGDMGGDLTCVYCGRDYSGSEDVRQSSRCESDDCPANIARAAIAKATGGAR